MICFLAFLLICYAASKIHPLHLRYFQFSGRVIALAMMHKIQVGVVLDRVFFLQLAGRKVSMEDIREADPCIYNSCKQILEMDAEFVDSDGLGLTFSTEVEELGTRKVVELCPGGTGIVLNSKNRQKYVDLIVQHHFVTSVAEQVSCFAQGFADILAEGKLRETFFESLELEDLDSMLLGSGSDICVEDWKLHTDYHGYKKSDPQMVWFWEVCGSSMLVILCCFSSFHVEVVNYLCVCVNLRSNQVFSFLYYFLLETLLFIFFLRFLFFFPSFLGLSSGVLVEFGYTDILAMYATKGQDHNSQQGSLSFSCC